LSLAYLPDKGLAQQPDCSRMLNIVMTVAIAGKTGRLLPFEEKVHHMK
jgi:hypothetical protein